MDTERRGEAGVLAIGEFASEGDAAPPVRWPESWLWPFGLANARYAQGDLAGARTALHAAQRIASDVPEIRSNLRFVEEALARR